MSRNPSKLEIGYAVINDLSSHPEALTRLSNISKGLQEVVASSEDKPFKVRVELDPRINTGLFEYMNFASHSKVNWVQTPRRGPFLPKYSTMTTFSGLIAEFDRGYHAEDSEKQTLVDDAIFQEAKRMTEELGLPDFYSGGYGTKTALEKRYSLFIIPLVEKTNAFLADFHNEYDAVVTPDHRNAESHHKWVKEGLGA